MRNKYGKLFEKTYIGKMGLKNRFVMAPMGTMLYRCF
jgi:2,4-dienoyl-CoA reductase-like NADH-dependent reductase (Old Yellow Enzyme family)